MLVSFPLKSNVWLSLLDSRSPSFMCLLERLSRLLFLHPLLIAGFLTRCTAFLQRKRWTAIERARRREGCIKIQMCLSRAFTSFDPLEISWSATAKWHKWFWVSKSELVQRQRKYLCHPLPSSSGGEKLESIQDGSARASLFGFNWSAEQLGGYPGQSASIPCRKSSGKLGKRSKISGGLF